MRRNLTELAANPDLISGIYNYCDRWCERCSFTSKCLVYATEQEDDDNSPETRDITNRAFWNKLASIFQEAREMISTWAAEEGIDINQIDPTLVAKIDKRHNDAEHHPLAVAGKEYADAVTAWFADLSRTGLVSNVVEDASNEEWSEQFQEASAVISWYQYQIVVKTIRALWSRQNESEGYEFYLDDSDPKDSDGSAKVALVGIDRSISAWRLMQLSLPERAELVVPLLLRLNRLRQATEKQFPTARDFVRPGFDEILGAAN